MSSINPVVVSVFLVGKGDPDFPLIAVSKSQPYISKMGSIMESPTQLSYRICASAFERLTGINIKSDGKSQEYEITLRPIGQAIKLDKKHLRKLRGSI